MTAPLPTLRRHQSQDQQLEALLDSALLSLAKNNPQGAIIEMVGAVKSAYGYGRGRRLPKDLHDRLEHIVAASGGFRG